MDAGGKTDEEVALEWLAAMEEWMKELGFIMNITELGATKEMILMLNTGLEQPDWLHISSEKFELRRWNGDMKFFV